MRPPRSLAAVVLAVPALAGAQLSSIGATGVAAPGAWQVACTVVPGASARATAVGTGACTGQFFDAVLVTAKPRGWDIAPTQPGAGPVAGPSAAAANRMSWVSTRADASLGTRSGGEAPLYEYTYRTSFDLTPGTDLASAGLRLDELRIDNYWVGWRLNGGPLVTTGGPPSTGANWTDTFTMSGLQSGSGALRVGQNTLELVIRGNGWNDGVAVRASLHDLNSLVTTTPEPGTWALLAGGLVGLGAVARRRRG